ncbi:MAG: DNA translocase FtsK 4TM domain-containing protein [Candidatus Paceibacterota bacterium]
MAKKKTRKKTSSKKEIDETEEGGGVFRNITSETKRGVTAILLLLGAVIFILPLIHQGGRAGEYIYKIFKTVFGIGYYFIPLILLFLGTELFRIRDRKTSWIHTLGGALFLVSLLSMVNISFIENHGGLVGKYSSMPFVYLFDAVGAVIILGGILIISLFLMFEKLPSLIRLWEIIMGLFRKKEGEEEEQVDEEVEEDLEQEEESYEEEYVAPAEPIAEVEEKSEEEDSEGFGLFKKRKRSNKGYTLPPLSLLEGDKGKPGVGDIKSNANIIKRTLANFGIQVEMDEITIGPTVTRYALKPAEGVKLSKIVALQNDLALALAAHPIRIEAPIPGKSLVGIEIPNKVKSTVGLASMLKEKDFMDPKKPLNVALGKGLSGKASFANISKMPHALIAGATGSGKSVTIHALITSLLYRNTPDELRFIFVDPKRVELTLYNGIPHLLTPVITESKKAILALKWAAKEMDRRYDILENNKVRDIASYLEKVYHPYVEKNGIDEDDENLPENLPYIVVIIDELADIMQMYPKELESGIVRLAQMSRAVGIHVILSTQRPSVNVITGLIKANIPSRIALQVSSQIDSRTILDAAGAEKLLGAGDMLYASGEMSQPIRLQSAFVSEEEVKKVVRHIIDQSKDIPPDEISLADRNLDNDGAIFSATLDDDDAGDDLYEEAREIVIAAGKASTSYLQRKLSIGYARAAKLIDILEEKGIVGPAQGAKPREVYEKPLNQDREDYESEE